jgi:ubiquinone/menaquinone biosynthesis C-methylase UbiE
VSRPGYIGFLSRAARLYDPVVHRMGFRALWDAIAACADPGPGQRCLDVCTGTGGVALALAGRGAQVVGLDTAAGMLAHAARKAHAAGLSERVALLRMDARELAFGDATFPVVTCSMSLHEMAEAERDRVLVEVRRVARERVVVADYRVPSGTARGLLFRARRAYEYLESDDFEGYAVRDVPARLESCGLRVEAPYDAGSYRIWSCAVVS